LEWSRKERKMKVEFYDSNGAYRFPLEIIDCTPKGIKAALVQQHKSYPHIKMNPPSTWRYFDPTRKDWVTGHIRISGHEEVEKLAQTHVEKVKEKVARKKKGPEPPIIGKSVAKVGGKTMVPVIPYCWPEHAKVTVQKKESERPARMVTESSAGQAGGGFVQVRRMVPIRSRDDSKPIDTSSQKTSERRMVPVRR